MRHLIRVLVLAIAALASPAHAEYQWQNLGADPYAATRAKAMKTRENAFNKLNLPKQVVALFLEATKKPGKDVQIVKDDKLSAMLSKGGVVHQDVVVAFTNAEAEQWQVSSEGKIYTVFLPKKCNNWGYQVTDAVPAVATLSAATSDCGEIQFPTKDGQPEVAVTFWGLVGIDLKNDACMQKNTALVACDRGAELCNFSKTKKVVKKELLMVMSYPTKPGVHALYVPKAFLDEKDDYVTCLVRVYGDETLPPVGDGKFDAATAHNKAVAKWKKDQYSDAVCIGYYGYPRSGVTKVYDSKAAMPPDAEFQIYFPNVREHMYPN